MSKEGSDWIVLKFGGTSVSSVENWKKISSVVQQRLDDGYSVCIVHSALSGISNLLQEIIDRASEGDVVNEIVETIKKRHIQLGQDLGVPVNELLGDYFEELKHLVKGVGLIGEASYRVQARLLSVGELMSTKLGAAYLQKEIGKADWLDARDLLTSSPQLNASERSLILSAICDTDADPELKSTFVEHGSLIVTQGFIASDRDGNTVVLGRGGSDVSAAYIAAKIGAERLEIWTDVPGMFSANPHEVPSARLLKHLSYEEAQEIATNGAKVLHPRSISPVRKHNIPIQVKCTQKPELPGTLISSDVSDDEALVKAIAVRPNVILVSMESIGMWQEVGFLANAFEVFKRYGLSIDLVSTSESNVTVSLDSGVNSHFQEVREEFSTELSEYCKVEIIESVSAVSLLGRHIRTILHQLGPAMEVFQEHQIYLMSQAANDLNFTFVVSSDQADRLVRQLHGQVISQSDTRQAFGPTWPELMEEEQAEPDFESAWWQDKKDELLGIIDEQGFSYVYNAETIRNYASLIQGITAVDQPLYAMKANANEEVLKTFRSLDFGFECVSIGEVEKVLDLFPDIDPKKILYTPNFAPRSEYEQALELDINVTLDNIFPLQQWSDTFRGRELFLRIDPGHGHGHHEHVKTGGIHSKFGIPRFEIEEVAELVEELDINVKGLHAHIGSGIKDPLSWKTTALILHEVAEQLGGVEILDLGGGFGIRENETQANLDMRRVEESLQEFKKAHSGYKLWVEPGRFLVATSGVLLARITQLKGKGNVRYVGIETGMNSFIRPALYGARHTIVNLTRLGEPATQTVNIVGPICESGDKLGLDRLFPASEAGDVVLIANTGAYGHVMSSNYNMRPPAGEVFLD